MMNFKKLLLGTLAGQALLASAAMAQTPTTVVTLTEVTPAPGKTVAARVLLPDGTSVPATAGMALPNGSQLTVLEGASVKGVYDKQGCTVGYGPKTKLEVNKQQPCAKGTQFSETKTITNSSKVVTTTSTPSVPLTTAAPVTAPSYSGIMIALGVGTGIAALSSKSINDNPKTK